MADNKPVPVTEGGHDKYGAGFIPRLKAGEIGTIPIGCLD